jgi:protein-S-isoprenylcysteine O-methyltransferase Ste14
VDILGCVTIALSAVWLGSEAGINARKRPSRSAAVDDRRSHLLLTVSTCVAIAAGLLIKLFSGVGAIRFLSPFAGYFGCLLMVGGMLFRWSAIAALQKQFTVDVAIVEDHQIVDTGLYGLIRHPSYLGALVTTIGLGLAWENWLGLLILVAVRMPGILYRISVEERVLIDHFGPAYMDYMKRTKGLIPGII